MGQNQATRGPQVFILVSFSRIRSDFQFRFGYLFLTLCVSHGSASRRSGASCGDAQLHGPTCDPGTDIGSWGANFRMWGWLKIKPPGDRRFWSMFPLTRVSFGFPVF